MNIEKIRHVLLKGANIGEARSLSMHKNFYQVMRGIGHNYTLQPVNIASIPKSMQNTNRRELKKNKCREQ